MALHRYKKLSESILFKNPYWTYKKDTFELHNGHKGEYHYVHTCGSSLVIPIRNDGRILLVKQYRYLNDRDSLEFVCGGVKETLSYEENASHELAEEGGFNAKHWRCIGEFNPFNGATDEMCKIYLATDLSPAKVAPDITEEFELQFYTPAEIDELIAQKEIWDGMTLAAWMIARAEALRTINR
jgi:ADP-ribose pyrophosphatase